jgi:hypothetical protein
MADPERSAQDAGFEAPAPRGHTTVRAALRRHAVREILDWWPAFVIGPVLSACLVGPVVIIAGCFVVPPGHDRAVVAAAIGGGLAVFVAVLVVKVWRLITAIARLARHGAIVPARVTSIRRSGTWVDLLIETDAHRVYEQSWVGRGDAPPWVDGGTLRALTLDGVRAAILLPAAGTTGGTYFVRTRPMPPGIRLSVSSTRPDRLPRAWLKRNR